MNKLEKKLRKDLEDTDLLEDLFGLTFGEGDCFYPVDPEMIFKKLFEEIR